MSSPRSLFRTVLNKNASHEARMAAIDELGEADSTTRLRTIVVTDGLDGVYRRRAVNILGRCRSYSTLEELTDNMTIHPALRQSAQQQSQF